MLFRSSTNTKPDSGQNLIDIGAISLARCTGSLGNIKQKEERRRKGILLATNNSLSQLFVWTELPMQYHSGLKPYVVIASYSSQQAARVEGHHNVCH